MDYFKVKKEINQAQVIKTSRNVNFNFYTFVNRKMHNPSHISIDGGLKLPAGSEEVAYPFSMKFCIVGFPEY